MSSIQQYLYPFSTLVTSVFDGILSKLLSRFNTPKPLLILGKMFGKQDIHSMLIQKGFDLCLKNPTQYGHYTFSFAFAAYKNNIKHKRYQSARELNPILVENLLTFGKTIFTLDFIEMKMDMNEWLCTQFITPEIFEDPSTMGEILITIESQLNTYWFVEWSDYHEQCINERRFLSGGSCNYVCWLRTSKEYLGAVTYVMRNTENLQLSELRYRTNPIHFEHLIGNGLGSFLDGHPVRFLDKAKVLIDRCETFIPEWTQGSTTYSIGCVYSRSGDFERALEYVKLSLELGETLEEVEQDEDFENLIKSPEYRKFKLSLS
jgi:hypothetical protein